MKCLIHGEHFGAKRKKIDLGSCLYTEAGYEPGISAPWHYHENAYFYYHLQGSLLEVNKKQQLLCRPGTALFHSWEDPHYDRDFSEDVQFYHIELGKDWFRKFELSSRQVEGSHHLENPLFRQLFQKIHWEVQRPDAVTSLVIESLLLQAYAGMMRYGSRDGLAAPAWVDRVRQVIHDEDLEKVTLHLLARETGVHAIHISREFARYFHTGFGEYIRRVKLQRAIDLLSDPDKSITDIAYSCGYADQSHFIRSFKKVYGISPDRYRRNGSG